MFPNRHYVQCNLERINKRQKMSPQSVQAVFPSGWSNLSMALGLPTFCQLSAV
jgi:hypothetical protein